ncbi:hypothetical protein Tco_1105997 [Tanacetum coccineum]
MAANGAGNDGPPPAGGDGLPVPDLRTMEECARCGNPVDGPYCRGCALLRKKFKEDLLQIVVKWNFPRPSRYFRMISFVTMYLLKSCGNGAHYGYNCPPKVPIISNPEPCNNQTVDELPQTLPSFDPTCYFGDGNLFTYDSTPNFVNDSPNVFNPPPQPQYVPYSCELCGNDAHHGYDCPPQVPFGIPDNMCDVPFRDNSPPLDISKDQFEDFSDSNDYSTSIDDDSFSIDDIEYVEASPPDSELVSLEVVEIVIPEVGGIDTDILLAIKDDILRENSLNFFLEETNTFDNSSLESETFCFNLEEISSGSTTTHFDYSLPNYEAFYDHIKEKGSGSTTTHADFSQYDSFIFNLSIHPLPPADRSDLYHEEFVDELSYIISPPEEPRVHVPNVLPTHPNLHLDSDFTLSSDSLGSDLVDEFSISFIRDPPLPVIDTLLPFLSENENKVVNPGILAASEEKSPHLSSHRGLKALNEIPMMISRGDIPNLDVPFLHFCPP